MDLKTLADELRVGNEWQYATGRFPWVQGVGSISENVGTAGKAKADDAKILKVASTCHMCGMSATHDETQETVAVASDTGSFLNLIRPKIEHKDGCFYGKK
jgi:hypothetical protein